MTVAPLVVLAVGNPSRGDDALGPRLASWLAGQKGDFDLIEDFQLQVEHALDLEGRRLVLFIDAGMNTPAPFFFRRLSADDAASPGHSTHALAPEGVLEVFQRTTGKPPPPAWLLCVRGETFGLGEPLGPVAETGLAAAMSFLPGLLARPDEETWDAVQR